MRVSLAGQPLGSVVAGPGFDTFRLPLPSPLPKDPPVLRLDVRGWRAPNDTRDLGVMVDRLAVEE